MTRRTFTLEMLQEHAQLRGGSLISKELINSTTYLVWCCHLGHKWRATPLEVLGKKSGKGSWCPKCPEESGTLLKLDDIE